VAAEAATSTVTTTFHHPFYDITQASFIDAVNLHPGDELQTTDTGETATVTAVRPYHTTELTYDLTIDGLHTYYVLAGTTPILVHNCGNNVYEAGGKHGTQARGSSRGTNSAEPADGQGALDNSVQIKPDNPNAPRRVGIDPSTGDTVILDRTGEIPCGCTEPGETNNLFHGHVRTDVNTDPGMIAAKNALRRAIKSGDITQ
jgi:hypothetical protein